MRFSSAVVCAFSALSLDTCGPHTGLFSYSLPKKLGAGPYGLYDKTSHYSKLTISGANDFSRTCSKPRRKKTLLGNDTNYIFKSNKHPLDMHIGCYLGYCLPMRRAMFTKIVNSLSDEYPFNTL